MPDRWTSYLCKLNDSVASIFLNLELRESAPDATRPWLLTVRVHLIHPGPDGLSSQEEFDTLLSIEDKLTPLVAKLCHAIYVGAITSEGYRRFYFYGSDSTGLHNAVSQCAKLFKKYKIQAGKKEDACWRHFLECMYPPEEIRQKIERRPTNQQLIHKMEQEGVTLQSPRNVRFWTYFKDATSRADFSNHAQVLGYRVDYESEDPAEMAPFCICLIKRHAMTLDSIESAEKELGAAAEKFQGDYDGWESEVINENAPS